MNHLNPLNLNLNMSLHICLHLRLYFQITMIMIGMIQYYTRWICLVSITKIIAISHYHKNLYNNEWDDSKTNCTLYNCK